MGSAEILFYILTGKLENSSVLLYVCFCCCIPKQLSTRKTRSGCY